MMGMASLALGLFLPPGSPERRRAVSGAMSLFSRHSICHLAEGGKLVEGFPEKATDDGPRRPNLFETMFKKREEETHEP